MKKFISGLIVGVIIFGALLTFAANYSAEPVGFKVLVNGKEFKSDPPALVVSGRTYLPLRAMGEALGIDVNWNESSRQVEVGNCATYDASQIKSQLTTTEYTWSTDYANYVALVVKNNSKSNIKLDAKLILKDSSGNLVGAKNEEVYAFEAGQEVCIIFNNEEKYNSYEYDYTVSEEDTYDCVLSSLVSKVNTTDKKAVISVTNNGSKAAEFVEYNILFFKGDKVVYSNWGYTVDSDSEIKPGKTEYSEASCYENFDSAKVYITARGDR